MSGTRVLFFLASFVFVILAGYFAIQYAKGYRFSLEKRQFSATGILVATSTPGAAQVFINGALKTATNQSINLVPGIYDVEIVKEGYLPWKKRLTVSAAAVTTTDALLFVRTPSLSPLTLYGATNPIISPDSTKLAWAAPRTHDNTDRAGIWVIELGNLPFGFVREARQVTDVELGSGTLSWSPDGRNIIFRRPNGTFLLDPATFTPQGQLVNVGAKKLVELEKSWQRYEDKKYASQVVKVPEAVADILTRKASAFIFTHDETKVLYTASASATLPDNLTPSLPGASTQKQERAIKQNHTYVYDIKEDRNFLVSDQEVAISHQQLTSSSQRTTLRWLPTSQHLLLAELDKITILEYDGTNKTVVWSSPYEAPFAFVTPDSAQLIILTTLGATNSEPPNLYTIKLR